jgi:hypothetical protein
LKKIPFICDGWQSNGRGCSIVLQGAVTVQTLSFSAQGFMPPISELGFVVNEVMFEHVPVTELPLAWRAKLTSATVTVRIEEEILVAAPVETSHQTGGTADKFVSHDPAFGIWRDREEMSDLAAYVRQIRQPRYRRDGSRNEP